MPESIPIRERICRAVKTAMETITGVGTVYRVNPAGVAAGTESYKTNDIIIVDRGEELADIEQANGYWVVKKRLEIGLAFVYLPDPESSVANADQRNRYMAAVEVAALSNRTWTVSGTRLATFTFIDSIDEPEFADGQWYCGITIMVEYMHEDGNPYRYSTAIAVLEE